jgi:hypothetical protein
MNNRILLPIFIFIIFISTFSSAELIVTYSVNSSTIKKVEEWIDKNTIIFIELDDVLVMPKSKMFSYDSNPYRTFINNLVKLGDKSELYMQAVANWYSQRKIRLVEEGWIDFIKRTREKGAKVYGLCSMPLYLVNIESARLQEILDLGIIFDNEINGLQEFIIKKEFTWFSGFYKGIIYTGPYSKHETILELFKNTNLSPEKLLVFANIKYELQLVDKALRRFNMSFKNILYLGSREVTGRPDAEVVKLQQRELIEKGKWYEDDEAMRILNSRQQSQNIKTR